MRFSIYYSINKTHLFELEDWMVLSKSSVFQVCLNQNYASILV